MALSMSGTSLAAAETSSRLGVLHRDLPSLWAECWALPLCGVQLPLLAPDLSGILRVEAGLGLDLEKGTYPRWSHKSETDS